MACAGILAVVVATVVGDYRAAAPVTSGPPGAASAAVASPSPSPSPAGWTVRFVGDPNDAPSDLPGRSASDPRTAALRTRIERELGGAVDSVVAFWGTDWPREIVVVLAGTDAEFAAQTAEPLRDWSGVAAVTVADRVDPAARSAAGQRIVFAPGAAEMSDAALRIVLRHELFHYAARADTAADAPAWLTEGVADFVARPDPPPGTPAPPAALPTDVELSGHGAAQSQAYDRAWWFTRFVADEYGWAALRRFYVAAGEPGHPDTDTAAVHALGSDLPGLLARWQRWQAAR